MKSDPRRKVLFQLAIARFVRANAFCAAILSTLFTLSASTVSSSAESVRGFGFLPVKEAEYQSFPKAKRYRAYLPPSVDLSRYFPTPGNQGLMNSCMGWAVGYAARAYYAMKLERRDTAKPENVPSPSFIYHAIRPQQNCKAGSQFNDALNLLKKGSLSLASFPYVDSCRIPNAAERASATDFRINGWESINLPALDDVKGQVARGKPVMFGMDVGDQFTNISGNLVYRGEYGAKEPHAMTVVGYDDTRQAFKIINSWGPGWGDGGFGWISYNAFEEGAREAYVMEVQASVPKPDPKPVVVLPDPEVPVPKPKPAVETQETQQETLAPEVVAPPIPKPKPVVSEPISEDDCSLVVSRREGEVVQLSGFVGTEEVLQRLKKDYQGPAYKIDVRVRPWPQCETLMTLAEPLRMPDAPGVSTISGETALNSGDVMGLKVTAPRQPSYVYVSYVQANGTVVNLQQPTGSAPNPSQSARQYVFGDGKEGRPEFKVAEPYGREIVVVLSSASPLFEQPLPEKQTEREFLTAVRKALIYKADPSLPDRVVSAAVLGIETREK